MQETDDQNQDQDAGSVDAVAASLFEAPAVEPGPEAAGEAADAPGEELPEANDEVAAENDTGATDYAVEDEQDAAEEPAKFSVKIDGKEAEVTLDELRRGYSGQQKIQQTMRELADQRKQAEQVYANLQAQAQQVEALRAQAESGAGLVKPTPPSRDMFATDPLGYIEARVEYEDAEKAWTEAQSTMQQHATQRDRAAQMENSVRLAEEARKVVEAIPEFGDREKAPKIKAQMAEVAQSTYGFSPDELAGLSDSRAVRILHDAMRFRQMERARTEAEAKAAPARQAIRPGAKRSDSTSQAKAREAAAKRMKSSGSVDDVAAFLIT